MNQLVCSLVVLLLVSACGPEVHSGSVSVFPDGVNLRLPEQEAGCRVLEPEFHATANGLGANFEDRGGGECRQVKLGGSLLTIVPRDPNATVRSCACRDAEVAAKNDDLAAFEFSVCSGDSCARASWPAPPAMPTLEAEPQADGWVLVRAVRTAPKDATEFFSISFLANGKGTLSTHSRTEYLADRSVRVKISEFDTDVVALGQWSISVEPSSCDFASCAPRSARDSTKLRLK
ncbi:MAG: hypothetical protein Q8L14_25435 [Myxococcales bacterium]|nr:hypothetical protein [Myxococcales bacterium]